ncbi:VRR-NUC domain-containing protein [Blastopirellula sp. J2-11]|uniref:VRR-NUC domain-containing protein n=1 Tax=Blastopirellula sp. J2-11 TaxID=2943192 RepID=UPI0021C57857|nr:VRR-NUC domain-containing protein [Blastopirellula sp. J2-11]UUO05325.1 VRR-NUC domain-containing protein [Blastopirellula sp. J2-11]
MPIHSFPVAEIHGRTTKIKRYYWRELLKRELELYGEWAAVHGVNPLIASDDAANAARQSAAEQALQEVKRLHETNPKYTFIPEPSQADIISECDVEVVSLQAMYVSDPANRRVRLMWQDQAINVEDFAQLHFRNEGYDSIALESIPFHVLFGIFMWPVIQDPDDERLEVCCFGDRQAYNDGEAGEIIRCHKPDDFGKPGYAKRRKEAIEEHFFESVDADNLEWLFEYWLEPSEKLRQYLWAHRAADIEKAQRLIRILPGEVLIAILRYLVDSYWERYLGWPDLLIFRDDDYFFAEVKSSKDKLSIEQKRWISDNHKALKLPFKLVKIHKLR